MKRITVPVNADDVNALLKGAREDDVLIRAADGTEFMLTAVDEFDQEIARTRHNAKLMALFDERARQTQTVPLKEVKEQLGPK